MYWQTHGRLTRPLGIPGHWLVTSLMLAGNQLFGKLAGEPVNPCPYPHSISPCHGVVLERKRIHRGLGL